MTRTKRNRWALALGLSAAAGRVAGAAPVPGTGALAGLVGAGPITMTTMLVCGACVGAGIGLVLSDSWAAALADMSAWKWIGICGAACATVVGLR